MINIDIRFAQHEFHLRESVLSKKPDTVLHRVFIIIDFFLHGN